MTQSLVTNRKSFLLQIIPVMLCFFVMGFVDLVGTASNYVQKDLGLSDSQANLFPSLVFFWFLIFSVPTGMLMNRIGRKNTVLISLIVTAASLFIPALGESYLVMLLAFSLLGIGNAIMQTSLNPLVTNLISGDKLASTLTFGQFVKAIASFLAPVIAAWGGYDGISDVRSWLACAVCNLCRHQLPFYLAAGCYTYRGGASRQGFGCGRVPPSAWPPVHLALFSWHNVSCGHRRGHQHHRPENHHGAFGIAARRGGVRHRGIFHIPYCRMFFGSFSVARHVAEGIFCHQRDLDACRCGDSFHRPQPCAALRWHRADWIR